MTDVTPLIPAGKQVIESYGRNGFHVSGTGYEGAIIIFPDVTLRWSVPDFVSITLESLMPAFGRGVEIMLLGCGQRMGAPLTFELRAALKREGIVIDAMDTGAACRTYNILLAEERRICAALLPAR